MSRHEARIYSLEWMYQIELGTLDRETLKLQLEEKALIKGEKAFVGELLSFVFDNEETLKKLIQPVLQKWTFNRLGVLERSILLLGSGEMMNCGRIPLVVSINEWVEVTKEYCGEESKKFVNGVLNGVMNQLIIQGIRQVEKQKGMENIISEEEAMYKIIRREQLGSQIVAMDVLAPKIAKKCSPGQFIVLRIDEKGERIPLTIADFDREKGTITIITQAVGYSSRKICAMQEGEAFIDFVGPLGQPTEIENYGTVLCVGGGAGIAPVYPIARALKEAGNKVISVIGARNKDLLIWKDKMGEISDELYVTTDDGSDGEKGLVTDVIKRLADKGGIAHAWAIGPVIMMKFVALLTKEYGLPTTVSMNPIMVDGTGMCGACRLEVDGNVKFACVDGPEFDGHKVNWDLSLRRMNIYKAKEAIALEKAEKGGF